MADLVEIPGVYDPHGPCVDVEQPADPQPLQTRLRDFVRTQNPASFGGISFDVSSDVKSGGRRLQIHEYPARDFWDNEDLGRATQTIAVDAFVDGPYVEARSERLLDICSTNGAHLLVLPFRKPHLARCLLCSSTTEEGKLGLIRFQMEFVLEPTQEGGIFPFTFLAQGVSNHASEGLSTLARLFNKRFDVLARRSKLTRVPAVARQAAAAAIKKAAMRLQHLLRQVTISDAEEATHINTALRFMINHSMDLAYSGERADRIESEVFVRAQDPAHIEFAWRWIEVLRRIYRTADSPDGVVDAAKALSKFERDETTQGPTCESVRMEAALAEEVAAFVRRSALLVHAQASVRLAFRARQTTVATSADISSRFNTEVARAPLLEVRGSGDSEIENAMIGVRDSAVTFLSRSGANLPDVRTFELAASLPAAVIATFLYNDCTWDADLVARNGALHPLFMPEMIEALRAKPLPTR